MAEPLEHKTYGVAELHTKGAKTSGQFEAIVSVFGNVDRENDRMVKGAFKRTLQAPSDGGRGYPAIVYAHQWNTVPIGVPQKCEEVEGVEVKDAAGKSRKVDGLFVDGELFVGDTQLATEVYTAMSRKGGDGLPALRDFSFGYKARDAAFVQENIDGKSTRIRDLKDVDLWEVGPCLVGMNPETALLGVKGESFLGILEALALGKAGARNSSTDAERLQAIHDMAVQNGAECAAAKALAGGRGSSGKLYLALAAKGYEDIDSWSVYRLTDMIEAGTSFIASEEDTDDVAKMRGVVNLLAQMLVDEINEQGETTDPISPDDLIEMASLPTSGVKSETDDSTATFRELMLAFPE